MREPCELKIRERVVNMAKTCFILHNMIVDMQLEGRFGDVDVVGEVFVGYTFTHSPEDNEIRGDFAESLTESLKRMTTVQNGAQHDRLQEALKNHLWASRGQNQQGV